MALTGYTIVEDTEEPTASDPIMQPAVEPAAAVASATTAPTAAAVEPVAVAQTPAGLTGFTPITDEVEEVETPVGDTLELAKDDPFEGLKNILSVQMGPKEAAAAIGLATAQEVVAGLSSLFRLAVNPAHPEKAVELAETVREFIPDYTPFTEKGQQILETSGKVLEPLARGLENVREWAGGSVQQAFEDSGISAKYPGLSAAVSTAAYIAPDLALEAFGYLLPKGTAAVVTKIDDARTSMQASKLMKEAVSVEQVFGEAKKIYSVLDDLDVKLNTDEFAKFAEETYLSMAKNGMRKSTTPKAYGAISDTLNIIQEFADQGGIPLTKLDELREVAKGPASMLTDPKEAALGSRMINAIDDFVDGATSDILVGDLDGTIAESFKFARELWGRGRRTEILQNAFQKAERNANVSFVKAVNTEYNKILQNDKLYKIFTPEEQKAIQAAATGAKGTNVIKALSSLGFYDGDGAGLAILRPMAAFGTASYLGGPAVGAAVPLIGQVSKPLAKHLVANEARLAESVIMAGKNGKQIAEQYVRYVPKAQQSAQGLAELLLTRGASTTNMLGKSRFIDDALAIMQNGAAAFSSAAVLESLAAIGKTTEETNE